MIKVGSKAKKWLGCAAVALSVVLMLGITLGIATDWGKVPLTAPEAEMAGGMYVEPGSDGGEEDGIVLVSQEIPKQEFAAYGIAPAAESAQTITATVTPSEAADKQVVWSLSWEDGSSGKWGNGKQVSTYVTGSASQDTHTYTLSCLQPFGETIVVTASLHAAPSVTKTRKVQYKQGYSSMSFKCEFLEPACLWSFTSADSSVTLPFPGGNTTDPSNLWQMMYSKTAPTVEVALSSVYTVAAEISAAKIEASYTSAYLGYINSAGGSAPATSAGSYVTLFELTKSGSSSGGVLNVLGTKGMASFNRSFFGPVLMKSPSHWTEIVGSIREASPAKMIDLRISVTVNGVEKTHTVGISFSKESMMVIPSGLDIGISDIVFGG